MVYYGTVINEDKFEWQGTLKMFGDLTSSKSVVWKPPNGERHSLLTHHLLTLYA